MFRFNLLIVVALVVVGTAATSSVKAQDTNGGYGYIPSGYGYGGLYMPGTPEGATNFGTGVGLGAFYTGMGNYNYYTGRGLEHLENAREHYLNNRPLAVRTYFDRKQINEEYRASKRPTPINMEQAVANARKALPNRLSTYDLSAATGAINWPDTLCDERFTALRERLSELFADRAQTGAGLGTPTHREIVAATQQFQTALKEATFKDKTNPLNSAHFLPAKKFLDSLSYESRFTPQSRAAELASN